MRVCHPGPERRKNSTTCGSRRTVTGTLCVAAFGRPRRRFIISANGIISAKSFAVSSRASGSAFMPALTRASLAAVFRLNLSLLPALLLLIASNLCVGRGAETDDAHRVFVPDRVDRHVKTVTFRRDADPAILVRIAGVIQCHLHRVPVELAGQIERDTVLLAVRLVFLRVELELHGIYCTYIKYCGQSGTCSRIEPSRPTGATGARVGDFQEWFR